MEIDDELESIKKKRFQEMMKKTGMKKRVNKIHSKDDENKEILKIETEANSEIKNGIEAQKLDLKEEEPESFDLILPAWVPPFMYQNAADQLNLKIIEREIEGPEADPVDPNGGFFIAKKKVWCVRGTIEQIDEFKKTVAQQLENYIKKDERKLTKASSWWGHYHKKEYADFRKGGYKDEFDEWAKKSDDKVK